MYKYEMDPTRTVGTTELKWDAGLMDRRTYGRGETNIPPQQLCCAAGIIMVIITQNDILDNVAYLVKNMCVHLNMASFKVRNSSQYLFYDETAFSPSNSRWPTSTMLKFTVHLAMCDTSNVEILKLLHPVPDTR